MKSSGAFVLLSLFVVFSLTKIHAEPLPASLQEIYDKLAALDLREKKIVEPFAAEAQEAMPVALDQMKILSEAIPQNSPYAVADLSLKIEKILQEQFKLTQGAEEVRRGSYVKISLPQKTTYFIPYRSKIGGSESSSDEKTQRVYRESFQLSTQLAVIIEPNEVTLAVESTKRFRGSHDEDSDAWFGARGGPFAREAQIRWAQEWKAPLGDRTLENLPVSQRVQEIEIQRQALEATLQSQRKLLKLSTEMRARNHP